jgi:hypothetical protein
MSKVAQVYKRNIECEVIFSEESVTLTLILLETSYMGRVKDILKTYQVEIVKNGKLNIRKLSVEVIKPKKSVLTLLPDFDPELLAKLKKRFGKVSDDSRHPSFLDENFLIRSGLWIIDVDDKYAFLKNPVKNTRRLKLYSRPRPVNMYIVGHFVSDFRIAHPDCPGLPEKCKNMCETSCFSYESHWKFICEVDVPDVILRSPEFWDRGFQPKEELDARISRYIDCGCFID